MQHISPELWISLALQFAVSCFQLGVFYATVRYHGKRLDKHDEQFEKHEESITALRVHTHLES